MPSYDRRTAATPTIFPKLQKDADKAVKLTIKLFQGLGGAEEGVRKIEDALRSISSMYGGGFFSGKPTEIDETMAGIRASLREFSAAAEAARGHANTTMNLLKKLRDQFGEQQ